MICRAEEFAFAVWLRGEILSLVDGVRDAPRMLWRDRSPNYVTLHAIQNLEDRSRARLTDLGMVRVIEHAPCGAPEHEERAGSSLITGKPGFWRVSVPGHQSETIEIKGGVLYLDGQTMEHAEDWRECQLKLPCPCRPQRVDHSVAVRNAWPAEAGSRMKVFSECLDMLHEARLRAESGRRRSGVRERLLRAVIALNDAIVPIAVEEHISERMSSERVT